METKLLFSLSIKKDESEPKYKIRFKGLLIGLVLFPLNFSHDANPGNTRDFTNFQTFILTCVSPFKNMKTLLQGF